MNKSKTQVAVIDVGSSKVTAVVGERGVNQTFVIKGEKSFKYEGFCVGEIYDIEGFKESIVQASNFIKKTVKGSVSTIYVGVPVAFTNIIVRDSQISFVKKKKITDQDVDKLFDSAFIPNGAKEVLINRSAIVYELDDYRRLANPVGSTSEILKGRLSFVFCDNKFIDIVSAGIKIACGSQVEFVPISIAQAMFLVNAEIRDRVAEILDVGYITTSLTIVQGDGVIFEKAIDYGGGYITAALAEGLEISFEEAEKLKNKINLSKNTENSIDYYGEEGQYYNTEEINRIVKLSLDTLCDSIAVTLEESGYSIPEYVKLMITGGGLVTIRGAKEHVANRLKRVVEVIAPKVPLLESPLKSSTLSLLSIALEQNN